MPTSTRSQEDVLNRDFLEVRSRILDLAAALDRHERAAKAAAPDPRLAQVRLAIEALLTTGDGRAEAVQRIFSLDYDPEWRSKFGTTHAPGTNGR